MEIKLRYYNEDSVTSRRGYEVNSHDVDYIDEVKDVWNFFSKNGLIPYVVCEVYDSEEEEFKDGFMTNEDIESFDSFFDEVSDLGNEYEEYNMNNMDVTTEILVHIPEEKLKSHKESLSKWFLKENLEVSDRFVEINKEISRLISERDSIDMYVKI